MSIQVSWDDDEQSAILYHFEGRWTLDEFYEAVTRGNALMDSVKHRVNTIFDVSKSASLPSGFLPAIRSIGGKPHANMGQMAVVGANAFIVSFINVFSKIFPSGGPKRRSMMVSSLAEARTRLAERNNVAV